MISLFLLKEETFLLKLGYRHDHQDSTISIHEVALCYNEFDWLKHINSSNQFTFFLVNHFDFFEKLIVLTAKKQEKGQCSASI